MICYSNSSSFRRLSLSDPLFCSGLSSRTYNALIKTRIHTIRDLLKYNKKMLLDIRGMGYKGLDETLDFLYHLHSYPAGHRIYPVTEDIAALLGLEPTPELKTSEGLQLPPELSDRCLDDLNISVRAYNALRRAGHHTIGDVARLSRKELSQIRNLGKTSVDEVLQEIKCFIDENTKTNQIDSAVSPHEIPGCNDFLRCVYKNKHALDTETYHEILSEFETASKEQRAVDYEALYKKKALRSIVINMITEFLAAHPFGLDQASLFSMFPDHFMLPSSSLEEILTQLHETGVIRIQDKNISLHRISVQELVNMMPDERLKNMINQRLHGVSLKEIGRQHNISNERVRQVTLNGIKKMCTKLEEDKYIPIFEKYQFNKEQFMRAFNESSETYYYLLIVCSKTGRIPISRFSGDPSLPPAVSRSIYKLRYNKFICIDGEEIEYSRPALTKHLIRTYFHDGVNFQDLLQKYNEVLTESGLESDVKLMINERSFVNHLRLMDFVLWTPGHRIRYYDINSFNYKKLLDTLRLDQYHDAEYSTRKFFVEYPELMEQYDIRDEYELHNLLRKLNIKGELKGVHFKRTPIVCFGQ